MADSPYAIRLELLKLARDMLQDQASVKQEKLRMEWDILPLDKKGAYPSLPYVKETDVILVAEKLNEFVSRKN